MSLEGVILEPTPLRAAVARQMAASKREVPHFYTSVEIQMDNILDELARTKESAPDLHITPTAALVCASAAALSRHRRLNSVWTADGLLQSNSIHVCVALATEGGVVAPALLDADRLDLLETAQALNDLLTRARSRKLKPPELTDGTFTLSNLGTHGVAAFAAIVTPPQIAVLATGEIQRRVVPDNLSGTRVSRMLTATLSADHRALDGADAAAFLNSVKELLSDPPLLARAHEEQEKVAT